MDKLKGKLHSTLRMDSATVYLTLGEDETQALIQFMEICTPVQKIQLNPWFVL